MKIFRALISILFLAAFLIGYVPAFADELDEQCTSECKNSGFTEGHYLAPEPGATCKEGFEKHPTDEICCCK